MAMTLSSIFVDGGDIPPVHTCDGADRSPPLAWSELPLGTKSLALIVDDPDAPDPAAPKTTWAHWLLYNVPPDVGPPGRRRQRAATRRDRRGKK